MDFQVHCCGNFTPYFANGRSMGISQIAAEFMGEKQSDEDQVCLFNMYMFSDCRALIMMCVTTNLFQKCWHQEIKRLECQIKLN